MRRDALVFLAGTLLALLAGSSNVRAYPTEDQDTLTTKPLGLETLCHFKTCNTMRNEPHATSDSSASSSEEKTEVDEHASKDTHEDDGVIFEAEKEEEFQRVKRASKKKNKDDDSSSSSSSSSSSDDDDDNDDDDDDNDNNHRKGSKHSKKQQEKDDDDDDDCDDDNDDDDDDDSSSSSSSSEEDKKKRGKRHIKDDTKSVSSSEEVKKVRFIRDVSTHLSEEKNNPTNQHIDEVKVDSGSKSSSKEDKSKTPKLIRVPLYRFKPYKPEDRFTRALQGTLDESKSSSEEVKKVRFIRGASKTHLSDEKNNPTNQHIDEVKVDSGSKSSSKEDKSKTPKLIRVPLYRFKPNKPENRFTRALQDTLDESKSSSEEIHTPKNRFTRALEDTSEESKSSSAKEKSEPKTRLVRSTEDSTSKLSSEKSDKALFLIPPYIEDVSRSQGIVKQTDKPHNRVTRSKDGKKKKVQKKKKKTKRHCTPKATTVKADTTLDQTMLPASHLPV